jgi:hypothetical protein
LNDNFIKKKDEYSSTCKIYNRKDNLCSNLLNQYEINQNNEESEKYKINKKYELEETIMPINSKVETNLNK